MYHKYHTDIKLADIAIIGGSYTGGINEVISIVNDSVSYSEKIIPSLPKQSYVIIKRGAQLSNEDLICEGHINNKMENWRLKDGSNQWENVGNGVVDTRWNSSFLIDGCFVQVQVAHHPIIFLNMKCLQRAL